MISIIEQNVQILKKMHISSKLFFASMVIKLALAIISAALIWIERGESRGGPVIALLILQHEVFSFYLGYSGISEENRFNLLGFAFLQIETVYRCTILVLSGDFTTQIWDFGVMSPVRSDIDSSIRICAVMMLSLLLLDLFLLPFVWKKMGWTFYKLIGTDLELKEMFHSYQRLSTVLRIDLQYSIRMIVFMFFLCVRYDILFHDLWCAIAILLVEVVWAPIIRIAIVRECTRKIKIAYLTAFIGLTIWLYFFIDYSLVMLSNRNIDLPKSQVYVIGFVIIVVRIISFVLCRYFAQNFGKGMKERVYAKLNLGPFLNLFARPKNQGAKFEFRTRVSIQDADEPNNGYSPMRG